MHLEAFLDPQLLSGPAAAALAAGLLIARLTYLVGRRWLCRPPWAYPEQPPLGRLEPLLDPFTAGSATERRESSRRRGHAVSVAVAEAGPGWVLDRSMGGLGLALPTPAPLGAVLNVRAANAPVGTPWAEVEVLHCRPEEDHQRVGCRFRQTPHMGVLLLFG